MKIYYAVLRDETGCEFPVEVMGSKREYAWTILREMYPESKIVQFESPAQVNQREKRMERFHRKMIDNLDY